MNRNHGIRKIVSCILAGALTFGISSPVTASIADEIAYAQQQKAYAEASISAAQSQIYGLESKKQELESYLYELNCQYEDLENAIADLENQTVEKEEELVTVKAELKQAQIEERNQYEAMKIRIVYMFERGGNTALQVLLSSGNFGDFLNQAENVMALSTYDRDMLTKYENTCKEVEEKEKQVNQQMEELANLIQEKNTKQNEVQELVSSTSESIQSYVYQISANQEEIAYLMAEVNSADSAIYGLLARQEAERAAQERYENESYDSDGEYSEDSEDEYYDESENYYQEEGGSESTEETYEESYEESYDDSSYYEESSSSSSGSGTYLGNFKLTAYCNCASCCGTAGNATASGVYPTPYHTVAMAGVPFGTQLLINGSVYTVEDLGTPYGHVDIFFSSHSEALSFGLQYADVYRLN